MKMRVIPLVLVFFLLSSAFARTNACPQSGIVRDIAGKTITLTGDNGDLEIRINYSQGCILDKILVKGTEVTGNGTSVFTGFTSAGSLYSSTSGSGNPDITIQGNTVRIDGLHMGSDKFAATEQWIFTLIGNDIRWQINREYLHNGTIDENFLPKWQFQSMATWDGAMLDNGGVAWNRFLNQAGDTYGAHTATLTFWSRARNSCLRVLSENAMQMNHTATFSHQQHDVYAIAQSSSAQAVDTRFSLRRFLTTGEPVFAPFAVSPSKISYQCVIQALTYDQEYDRGVLKGVDEASVNEILNTIGRYGVVDRFLYGSNGWRTGWTVLQEPWLALFGYAINSPDFIQGFSQALDYAKEHAVLPDGRVLPRWHHDDSDAMPNTFTADGFYECCWGYMLDAQPAFAIDVAEQFDLTSDTAWLRSYKTTCEQVLEYMLQRDTDGNGLFEVVQKSHQENQGTDWLDVIWASNEVSTINAYLYMALTRWSELEALLGDTSRADRYHLLAEKLQIAFNKNTDEGGFWDPKNQWYVHWREADGSVYGNNLNCVVNFLAIGYGLCTDPARKHKILSQIENQMKKEKLFIWPSCFYPYEEKVGLQSVNYPFPNYENGDLFLAWAELGTRCYADEQPEIAMKYIHQVIKQYEKDGLGYQRYTRVAQAGAGDDILSNNIMAIVGLYRNIYGIRPQYNRLYLEPHLTKDLNGTQIKYHWLNQDYFIDLSQKKISVRSNQMQVSGAKPFAVHMLPAKLEYFHQGVSDVSLCVSGSSTCSVDLMVWEEDNRVWKEQAGIQKTLVQHTLHHLKPHTLYQLRINNQLVRKVMTDAAGVLNFDYPVDQGVLKIQVKKA